jgi:transcriptional regulator GlxA family with amidase domain
MVWPDPGALAAGELSRPRRTLPAWGHAKLPDSSNGYSERWPGSSMRGKGSEMTEPTYIPGGCTNITAVDTDELARLRADPRVLALVLQHHEAGAWLAAICAAPTVLHDAGLLAGRRYTAHPSVANELTAILAAERTVTDGKILTSRGAGTALDFGLALVAHLTTPATAAEIHRAICA